MFQKKYKKRWKSKRRKIKLDGAGLWLPPEVSRLQSGPPPWKVWEVEPRSENTAGIEDGALPWGDTSPYPNLTGE